MVPPRAAPVALLAALPLAAACSAAPPPPVDPTSQPAQIAVEKVPDAPAKAEAPADRLGVQILVVQDTASFLDRRRLELGTGSLRVSLRGVPGDLDPASVGVRSLTPGARLELVEAKFFGGTVTPALLLGPYVGKEVTAYLWDEGTQKEAARTAILVGFADGLPVVSIDKQVRVLETGRVAVPKLPEALREEPTLELLVTSDRAAQEVEISYRSRRVDADMLYQLVRPPGAQTALLQALVAVQNDTATALSDAGIVLSSETAEPTDFGLADTGAKAAGGPTPPTTLVRLPAPISLPAGQRALVRLFGPTEVGLTRKVVVEGPGLPTWATTPEEVANGSMRAVLDAATAKGEPLSPHGMVGGQAHLFERAAGEPPRAYGTAAARPLPGARGVRVDLGDERKYPSRRKMTSRRDLGRCVVETAWEVAVSNPTENPLPIEDVEPVTGKYQVLESSVPVAAAEPDHFVFALDVPANGEAKVRFKVRTTSCQQKRRAYWQQWSKKGSPKSEYYK